MPTTQHPDQRKSSDSHFYAIAWRWHFYSGLYILPFLMVLAITGLVMVFYTGFESRLGPVVHVSAQGTAQSITAQAGAALKTFPQGALKEYIAPKTPAQAAWFVVSHDGITDAVAVNPYTAAVVKVVDKENTVFAWAQKVHGKLLLGDMGGHLIEVAAGLGITMIMTGLYLFWPRHSAWAEVLMPNWSAKGRKWWKSLHASLGFWMSSILFLFLLTGMSWTEIWGAKLVQPWGTFPAAKWDSVPHSDTTHAALNPPGLREVPWGLEQTPLPASSQNAEAMGAAAWEPVTLDSVAALATRLGFAGPFHINIPHNAEGVYTISADTMSGDLQNPFQDRTVHVDRYTGKVLAEAAFADYSPIAKSMAVGVALHQGDLGLWNAWINVLFCSCTVLVCASGAVVWWMRRPQGRGRLGAPPIPVAPPFWKTGAVVMAVTALAFPLTGGVLLAVLLLDWLVLSRIPVLKAILA